MVHGGWWCNRHCLFMQIRFSKYIYRPQTKFARVMFSQVFVCPRGAGGGSRSLSRGSLSWGISIQVSVQGVSVLGDLNPGLCPGGLCPGGSQSRSLSSRSLSWGISIQVSVQEVSVLGDLNPGLCPGGLCPGGLCPGWSQSRSLSMGVSVLGVSVWGSLSMGVSVLGVSVWGSLSRGSLSPGGGGLCPGGLCHGDPPVR